ncbi:MAG: hypothetical protein KGO82_03760 [Bacteroidota bacterium]|nr:hypothetical protein [Bacteroidota bacterium]
MRRRFVLYKINDIPGGNSSISYLKAFKNRRPVYTMSKTEARRFSLVRAFFLAIRFSLSALPERLA